MKSDPRIERIESCVPPTLGVTAFAMISILLAVLVWAPTDVLATQWNSRVTGNVVDASGSPLEGVKVTIALTSNRRVDPFPPAIVTSDKDGFFLARNVQLGHSRIIFELDGFETVVIERELRVGPQRVDVTMVVDAARAKVEAANIANEHYQAGYEAFVAEDFDRAIQSLEQALEMIDDTEENAEARGSIFALIGRAYFEQRQFAEAAEQYEHWVRYQPADPNAHIELATALSESGNRDAAMEHFQHALELNPDDAISLFNIGIAMVNSGSVEEGISYIERGLEAQPNSPVALKNLGYAYARLEKYREAIGVFEKYVEQTPDAEDAPQIRDFIAALKEMIG